MNVLHNIFSCGPDKINTYRRHLISKFTAISLNIHKTCKFFVLLESKMFESYFFRKIEHNMFVELIQSVKIRYSNVSQFNVSVILCW